jgi:hypothetical protein
VLILGNALLLLLLLAPDIIWLTSLERGDEGGLRVRLGRCPSGHGRLYFSGRPLNLVLYMPFRIFAYSSNIFKANFAL